MRTLVQAAWLAGATAFLAPALPRPAPRRAVDAAPKPASVRQAVDSRIDDDYADYYYSVPAGGALPAFQADGGWDSVGANLLVGVDLDGNLANGGLSLIALGGYSRQLGDSKDTPFTAIRGDADQWMGAIGIGYTF